MSEINERLDDFNYILGNKFYDRDQFAHMLNKLISKFLEKNQQRLTNAEKLGVVQKFNPFFIGLYLFN